MLFSEESIKKVNKALSDPVSKEIFANRLLYSITGDKNYIKFVTRTCETINTLLDKLCYNNRPIVICCINNRIEKIINNYPELNWTAFSDINPELTEFHNLKKIDRNMIHKVYPNAVVFISAIKSSTVIKSELIENGIPEDDIVIFSDYLNKVQKLQYFDLPQLNIGCDEIFVDCGAYDMFNSDQIIDYCKKIYAFEPDQRNYEFCVNKYKDYIDEGKAAIYPYATLDKRTFLSFSSNRKGSSSLSETKGDTTVECIALDEIITDNVTFIKMDVEGAEYASLLGCKRLIKQFHPKLAICIYHLKDDIVKIPELILNLDPSYKLYLRHYKFDEHETVLYAV